MEEMSLQGNLKKYRKENGYTQKQLADYLGITRQAYAHYEVGNRAPNYVVLVKIADFYGVSMESLLAVGKKKTKSVGKDVSYSYLPEKEQQLIQMMGELTKEEQEDLILYLKRKINRKQEREGKKWKTL